MIEISFDVPEATKYRSCTGSIGQGLGIGHDGRERDRIHEHAGIGQLTICLQRAVEIVDVAGQRIDLEIFGIEEAEVARVEHAKAHRGVGRRDRGNGILCLIGDIEKAVVGIVAKAGRLAVNDLRP